jgi:hypothetical protein
MRGFHGLNRSFGVLLESRRLIEKVFARTYWLRAKVEEARPLHELQLRILETGPASKGGSLEK